MLSLRDTILLAISIPLLLLAIGLGYAAHGPLPNIPYESVGPRELRAAIAPSKTPTPRTVPTARPRIIPTELPPEIDPAEFYGAEWPSVDGDSFEWDQAVPLCHYPESSVASNIARDSVFTYQSPVVARIHTERHGLDYISYSQSGCYEDPKSEDEPEESYANDDEEDDDPWANWISD